MRGDGGLRVAWLACAVALAAGACGGGTLTADGASMAPDGASPDSVSPGMCGADVPPGQECNALANVGGIVTPTCTTGTAPTGTGGTIVDGTYVLTSATKYDASCTTPVPFAETVEIAGDCLQVVFGDILSGTDSGRLTTQGTSIAFTQTCVHVDTDGAIFVPDVSMKTYTATTATLTLFAVNATTGTSDVSVFTRR